MCLRDLLNALRSEGIEMTETQLRWAIRTGKVSRPPLDGSNRFCFSERHLREIRVHVSRTHAKRAVGGRS